MMLRLARGPWTWLCFWPLGWHEVALVGVDGLAPTRHWGGLDGDIAVGSVGSLVDAPN